MFWKKKSRKTVEKYRPSFIERLETRQLMSVTVSQYYPGFYDVTPEGSSNVAAIEVDQQASLMTVDGQQYTGVQFIWFHCNNLGDAVSIHSNDSNGYISAAIDGGAGNDNLSLVNMSGVIHGYGGTDTLKIQNCFYGQVYGDTDDHSYITVAGNCFGAAVCAGTGGSTINCMDSTTGLKIYGGEGNDWIYGTRYDDEIYWGGGDDTMFGITGNDQYFIGSNCTVYGTQAYGGNDFAWIEAGATNVSLHNVAHFTP